MEWSDLINNTGEWLKGTGPNSNIVMSSRIRLARNLQQVSFPNRASKKDLTDVIEMMQKTMAQVDGLKEAMFIKINDLDNIDKQFLVERHLMSHEHATNTEAKALIVSPDENVSVMINEEDHLRIQGMRSGFNLLEAWNFIDEIDDSLSNKLEFAYLND